MSYPTQLTALGLILAVQVGTAAATESSGAFRIMSGEEVTAHTAAMNTLQGSAREDYRNAQYEQLRQRALEQGYSMPPSPPWQTAATVQTTSPADVAEAAPAAAQGQDAMSDAAARHAAMREKMRAHREALLQAANAKPAEPGAMPDATPAPPAVAVPAEAPPPGAAAAATVEVPTPTPTVDAEPVVVETPAAADTEAVLGAAPKVEFAPAPTIEMSAESTVAAPPVASLSVTEQAPSIAATPADPAQPDAADAALASPQRSDTTAGAYASSDAMNAYREAMRSRFDDYIKERQAQVEEAARLQREQHEANMEKNRAARPAQNRFSPYPYPTAPAYGPRYPSAYPGYRTPYWQQR